MDNPCLFDDNTTTLVLGFTSRTLFSEMIYAVAVNEGICWTRSAGTNGMPASATAVGTIAPICAKPSSAREPTALELVSKALRMVSSSCFARCRVA